MKRALHRVIVLLSIVGAASVVACVTGGAESIRSAASSLVGDDDQGGGNGNEFEPSSPVLNAATSPIAVDGSAPQMVNIDQQASKTFTLDAVWAPEPSDAGTEPVGRLAFRSSASSSLFGYVLQIDAIGQPSLLVYLPEDGGGGVDKTVLAQGSSLVMTAGSYDFELVADDDVFTVTDSNRGGKQVLSFTDPNMRSYPYDKSDPNAFAYVDAPAVWVDSPGDGSWQLSVHQQGAGVRMPLGVASVVLPDTDQDNRQEIDDAGTILVNHFDILQPATTEIDFMVSSMLDAGLSGELGKVTIHRQDLTGTGESDVSDYSVHVFPDKIEIHKQYGGLGETIASAPLGGVVIDEESVFPGGVLAPGAELPLQVVAYDHAGTVTLNVNLTDMGQVGDGGVLLDLTPETNPETVFDGGLVVLDGKPLHQDATYVHILANILTWTDAPGGPDMPPTDPMGWPLYFGGVRFGLYTANHQFNCWDNLALINRPGVP